MEMLWPCIVTGSQSESAERKTQPVKWLWETYLSAREEKSKCKFVTSLWDDTKSSSNLWEDPHFMEVCGDMWKEMAGQVCLMSHPPLLINTRAKLFSTSKETLSTGCSLTRLYKMPACHVCFARQHTGSLPPLLIGCLTWCMFKKIKNKNWSHYRVETKRWCGRCKRRALSVFTMQTT